MKYKERFISYLSENYTNFNWHIDEDEQCKYVECNLQNKIIIKICSAIPGSSYKLNVLLSNGQSMSTTDVPHLQEMYVNIIYLIKEHEEDRFYQDAFHIMQPIVEDIIKTKEG